MATSMKSPGRHRKERVRGGSLNRLAFHVSGPRPDTTILAYELVE